MAYTIARDILNPKTAGNRDTTTNAGVRLNVENAMEIPLRLNNFTDDGPRPLRSGFRKMLFSNPNVAEDQAENAQWQPVRSLGKGGMGWVTLWKKYDANNMEVDGCAIKEQPFCERIHQYYGLTRGVSKEAAYQYQLNTSPDGNVTLKLRRYKLYENERLNRLYFEYCPHMDLQVLWWRYRCWDTFLPELFLWHVFVSLAKAAVLLEDGNQPWEILYPGGTTKASGRSALPSFLLHLDIKPQNIFLQNPPEKSNFRADPTSIYPQIKLADYGLAILMGPFQDEPNHPDYPGQHGTPGFRAPEQCLRSAEWKTPLNGQRPVEEGLGDAEYCQRTILESADGYGIRYGAKVNVWAIGKVMRDLYYLNNGDQYDESAFDAFESAEQEERYRKYGYNMRPFDELPEGPPDYSPLLLAHIDGCMALDAEARLSSAEVLQNAKAGLQDCIQTIRDKKCGPDHKLVRLAFRGNEINNLPRGDHKFDQDVNRMDKYFMYEYLVDNQYKDIRWGRLKPPYQKWKREIDRDLKWAQENAAWPTGEGPFRWDGSKVVLASDYEPGKEVFPGLVDILGYSDSSDDSDPDEDDPTAPWPPAAPILPPAPILPTVPAAARTALPPAPILPAGYPVAGRRACRHLCLNKVTCGHGNCCKLGV